MTFDLPKPKRFYVTQAQHKRQGSRMKLTSALMDHQGKIG